MKFDTSILHENNIQQAINELMKEQPKPTPIKVGDIFRMSWGYDQTNVDYFEVVRLTPKGVVVSEIAHEQVPGTNKGGMCCQVRPRPGVFLGQSSWVKNNVVGITRKVGYCDGKAVLSFGRRYVAFRIASPIEQTFCSWYA